MALPLPIRPPAVRLRDAREDHARCLSLAAWYRDLHRRDDLGMRERHAWAMGHARALRGRHLDPSTLRAAPS